MKKQEKKAISLQKLTIARIQINEMNHVKGGDCIPTDGTDWYKHSNNCSDLYCTTNDLP